VCSNNLHNTLLTCSSYAHSGPVCPGAKQTDRSVWLVPPLSDHQHGGVHLTDCPAPWPQNSALPDVITCQRGSLNSESSSLRMALRMSSSVA